MVKVEFIEVPEVGPVGTVLYSFECRLAIDAKAKLPRRGEEVQLPHPHRKQRTVSNIVWKYKKTGIVIQVHLVERERPHPSRARRATTTRVREASKKLTGSRR